MKNKSHLIDFVNSQRSHLTQLGNNSRGANRDYKEISNHWTIHENWELTEAMKELDAKAIRNEKFFIRRFGFDAPLEQRTDVIDLKNYQDFTDLEISSLKKSGFLILQKGKPTCLHANIATFLMGFIFFVIAIFFISIFALGLTEAKHPTAIQLVEIFLMMAVCVMPLKVSIRNVFQPLNILHQRGIWLGKKWVLREHVPLQKINEFSAENKLDNE